MLCFSLLHCAARIGSMGIIKYLLEERELGWTLFVETTRAGRHCTSLAETDNLLSPSTSWKTDNPMTRSSALRRTTLHVACLYGKLEIVKYLVEQREANTERRSGRQCQCNSLQLASLSGYLQIVQTEQTGNDGWTALHCAANNGHMEIVKHLAEQHGSDADAKI
jgi:ankyrin repeat protein